jgi:hypothetical protein
MRTPRVLYQLMRADFLERVRRYSFHVTLALTAYLGYFVSVGAISLRFGHYRGLYNSAWVGSLMTLTTCMVLSLFGFYVVKNCISRDERTRVGQVIAATPVGKLVYLLGKWLSNFAVLSAMVCVMAAAAVCMQLIRGEETRLDAAALVLPFLLIALPVMAVVAALALLFESVSWLRGGFGNVVYFFLFLCAMAFPVVHALLGWDIIQPGMEAAVRAQHADYDGNWAFTVIRGAGDPATFLWEGIEWDGATVLGRLQWFVWALVIVSASAVFFNRFDPRRGFVSQQLHALGRGLRGLVPRGRGVAPVPSLIESGTDLSASPRHAPLSALHERARRFRFTQMLWAELRLTLRGRRWWWWLVACGLFAASVLSPLDAARQFVLPLLWMWPLTVWSAMGAREKEHATFELIYSAESAVGRQLPATYAAGVAVSAMAGAGVAVRLALSQDWSGLSAWCAAALFIPALALALGTVGGSSRWFEVVYTLLWYLGPINGVPAFDFAGASGAGAPVAYLTLSLLLLGASVFTRQRQVALRA